ncbi:sensor histidine kinase KdpD [Dyadobacter sp. Leaf189]|uniref:sensor histidine kinase n=1 Tax=Dyadobacter sp. Leaf189 TaxID=1736295 RepID=UPI0006FE1370|nr:HAMP domain-containing sensor histidine kinase [Dyadobacter sp. Leaf189]KQS27677.1 histidine kinase [Dyadobacter sp. Leaf189]
MSSSFLEWPVRKQLATEVNTLDRVRIRVLAYILHLRILSTGVLLVFFLLQDYEQQSVRIAVLFCVSLLFYIALTLGLHWRLAIHIAVNVFLFILWTNLFIVDKTLNLVTIQYAGIASVCAFYGLGNRLGLIYSAIALAAFVLYLALGNTVGAEIPLGPLGSGSFAAALFLVNDFFFLVLIHYYFFSSFNATMEVLDARTIELTENIGKLEQAQIKQQEEFVHQKHLLASISHDIKSPLRFLMTTTARLAKNYPDLPTVRAISQSSYRLYNFMKNLLEYTEFRYKNTDVNFAYLDVCELVEQKLDIFAEQAESQCNSLVNAVESGVILKSNLQLVGIILHNLIDNANKVTSQGQIKITCEDHRNQLHLIVSDTGPGMDPGIMEWINSPHRIPGPEHNPQSFGMGLLIVKEISGLIRAKLLAQPFTPRGTSIHIIFSKNNP